MPPTPIDDRGARGDRRRPRRSTASRRQGPESRRPRRPDARRRARAGAAARDRHRRARAGSRWSRAARRRTRRAGWAGSGAQVDADRRGRSRRAPAGRSWRRVRSDGVTPRVVRVAGARTGRIGVLVAPGGERSLRGRPGRGRPARGRTTSGRRGSTAPTPSTCRSTRCSASRSGWPAGGRSSWRAGAGAIVSVDLASIGPLLAEGRRAARALIAEVAPDLLFATAAEAEALLGRPWRRGPARVRADRRRQARAEGRDRAGPSRRAAAPVRGRDRARRRRPTRPAPATRSMPGSSSAGSRPATAGRSLAASLQRAALAGHRAAARQLSTPRPELPLG